MKKKTTKPSIRMLLARLGRTKEAVAKKLLKLDCRGYRNHGYECPIGTYLQRVGRRSFVEHNFVYDDTDWTYAIRLPPPVKAFVRSFDRGEFLELLT